MSKPIESITDLIGDDRNANTGTPRGRDMVERSLREYGAGRSVLVDRNNKLIAGNKTSEAFAAIGLDRVRVVETDGNELVVVKRIDLDLDSDPRARELAIGDNRSGELGLEWDAEVLASLDEEIDLSGFWSRDELEMLLHESVPDPIGDPDALPAIPDESYVQRGQMWALGTHRLLCGDASNPDDVARVMPADVGALVFDPPYDADAAIVALRWAARDVLLFTDHRHLLDAVDGWPSFRSLFVWDGVTSWYTPGWPLARGKFALWFGDSKYDADGSHYGESGKAHEVSNPRGNYMYQPDPRGKHLSTIFQSPATQQFDGHAHAKPVDWIRLLLANCTSGDIFDPFAGSGTSIIAAHQLKRRCAAIEYEPANCQVIIERWQAFTGLRSELVADDAGSYDA